MRKEYNDRNNAPLVNPGITHGEFKRDALKIAANYTQAINGRCLMRKVWIEFDRALNEGEAETVLATLESLFGYAEGFGYCEHDGIERFSAPYVSEINLDKVTHAIDSAETGLEIVNIYLKGLA